MEEEEICCAQNRERNVKVMANKAREMKYALWGISRNACSKIGKSEQPTCIYGDGAEDDAKRTSFQGMRWEQERQTRANSAGYITAENVKDKMIRSEETWEILSGFAEEILRMKRRDLEVDT